MPWKRQRLEGQRAQPAVTGTDVWPVPWQGAVKSFDAVVVTSATLFGGSKRLPGGVQLPSCLAPFVVGVTV